MMLLDFVSWLAAVTTVGLYLTGIPICRKIIHKGNTQDVSFFPFIVMFCNTTLWVKYALIKGDDTMLYCNAIGALLNLVFIIVYYVYTLQRTLVHRMLIFGGTLLFPILIFVKFYAANQDEALLYLGFVCSVASVIGYGSPLSAMSQVLRTKSTECMAFPLSLANFIVGVEWFTYGYLLRDIYVQIPNFIGVLLGVVQLYLFWKYPSKKTTSTTSTGPL